MLHRLRSSRRLEDACYSRLDVIWQMRGQTPDHSTIADFVGGRGKALRRLFRDALGVLLEAGLVTLSHVAIDGSKVEADAGKNSVRGEEKIRSWQGHLDGQIAKSAFVYDAKKDEYRCPAGESLVFLRTSQDKKKWGTAMRRQYGSRDRDGGCTACSRCGRAKSCCKNPEKGRLLSRDQYEAHRERLRRRMATPAGRDIYKRRKHTVEPRIGHVKHNMGIRRFMRRGIENVFGRVDDGLYGGEPGDHAAPLGGNRESAVETAGGGLREAQSTLKIDRITRQAST